MAVLASRGCCRTMQNFAEHRGSPQGFCGNGADSGNAVRIAVIGGGSAWRALRGRSPSDASVRSSSRDVGAQEDCVGPSR